MKFNELQELPELHKLNNALGQFIGETEVEMFGPDTGPDLDDDGNPIISEVTKAPINSARERRDTNTPLEGKLFLLPQHAAAVELRHAIAKFVANKE